MYKTGYHGQWVFQMSGKYSTPQEQVSSSCVTDKGSIGSASAELYIIHDVIHCIIS